MKYSQKLVDTIVDLLQDDMFTIAQICEMAGISRKTFYKWMDERPEFREEVERAKEFCEDQLIMKARRALQDRLEGHTVTETVITYVPDEDEATGFRLKKKVVKMKQYPANPTIIKQIIDRGDKIEQKRRSQKENAPAPKKSFQEYLEAVKQQYGFYNIIRPATDLETKITEEKETVVKV